LTGDWGESNGKETSKKQPPRTGVSAPHEVVTFLLEMSPTPDGTSSDRLAYLAEEEFMEIEEDSREGLHAIDATANRMPAQQVVKAAHEELLQLMRQRAEIMRRIGTVKQTIAGLADLFGEQVLGDDLLELIDRKPNGRQPGFTKACRRVLMEVRRPLGAREVCMELERCAPAILARHKDPLASVTTVLNRLVDYGEARSLSNDRGRRVWEWISDGEPTADEIASRKTA
jgi:hypothetical protein